MAGFMQFWGVEVKAKEPCRVTLGGGSLIHISQATLGEPKMDKETVTVHVKVGEKKLVLAFLSQDTPQRSFDLIFDEDFEISHNWKNGSIYLLGYQNDMEIDSEIDSSDEEEEDVPIAKENGHLAAPAAAPAVKPKAAAMSMAVYSNSDEDDSSDDEEGDSSDEDDDDDDDDDVDNTEDGTSVSEDDEDDSDDSEEETPAKVVDAGKKRPNADAKTPPKAKKAKVVTPQKTDGKKGGQPTTPLASSKKGGKTPGGDKTPKSGGSDVSCGSCKKTFKSGTALESHNKAKHSAK